MIAPSWICAGATRGTNWLEPGTRTSTAPVTGSTLTLLPATGRGRPRWLVVPVTCTSVVPAVELPAPSVAVALAVNVPALLKVCVSEVPSPDWPSPKSQWIAGGPLQMSVAVASNCVEAPSSRLAALAVGPDSTGGTGSKTAVSTAVEPAAQAACTCPAPSAATTGAELPAGASWLDANKPPCEWTA